MRVRTNLPLLIRNRGYNNSRLARETGILRTYIVYIADGRMIPTDEQLEKICLALNVTPDMVYPDPSVLKAMEAS